MSRGTDFENLSLCFFKGLFQKMGYVILEAKRQKSGTQFGFDIFIRFLDDSEAERTIHIECKDYSGNIDISKFILKAHQLASTSYTPDGFIGLSPKSDLSNMEHLELESFKKQFKFPIEIWSPNHGIEEIFSLDRGVYRQIYNTDPRNDLDPTEIITKTKARIDNILKKKLLIDMCNQIIIRDATRNPDERNELKTNLDKKLDSIFDVNDPIRLKYHKYRCDYKVYLEELQDTNNDLRLKILRWQDNLREKAEILTRRFSQDTRYKPSDFFYDFFDEAEKSLSIIVQGSGIGGDTIKLLYGMIFELAAECPLDWRKK